MKNKVLCALSLALAAFMGTFAFAACNKGGGETAPDHEHVCSEWVTVTPADCENDGLKKGNCTVCGTEVTEAIPSTGHKPATKPESILSFADCENPGKEVHKCEACGNDVEVTIPALGHDWEREEINLTEPTCTEKGSVRAKCKRAGCGKEDVIDVPALGHDWETSYTVETPATFDTAGKMYRKCTRCEEHTDEREISRFEDDKETLFSLRLVRNNGDLIKIAGVNYRITDSNNEVKATGTFRSGTALVSLLPAEYTVTLTNLPRGYSAESSYSISWRDINPKIALTGSLIEDTPDANVQYVKGSVMHDYTFEILKTSAWEGAETLTLSELLAEYELVVINFWDTSCTYCEYEFPGMNLAYEKYKDRVAIIAVDDPNGIGGIETPSQVISYANSHKLAFPVAMDDNNLADKFGVPNSGYPTTVIIDREGAVAEVHTNALINPADFYDEEYSCNLFAALFDKFLSPSAAAQTVSPVPVFDVKHN